MKQSGSDYLKRSWFLEVFFQLCIIQQLVRCLSLNIQLVVADVVKHVIVTRPDYYNTALYRQTLALQQCTQK